MFVLSESAKIYIAAPPAYASGGPELLHQLCYNLKKAGFNSEMYYFDESNPDGIYEQPVHERYLFYNTSYVTELEDCSDNLLIVPESITTPLKKYKHLKKCVWWLGANNYFWFKETCNSKYKLTCVYHWVKYILGMQTPLTFSDIKKNSSYHLAQCWYTVCFLERKGIHNVAYLSDCLNNEFLESTKVEEQAHKKDIILYNPSRNYNFIKILKEKDSSLQFIPIQGMTLLEVHSMMQSAKLYVDFGAHPGKDRMPREAALSGCCIMTSTLGSADFYDDLPIDSQYKFERKKTNINVILDKIHFILKNYESEKTNFDNYRSYIRNEPAVFDSDIKKLFTRKKDV